MEVCPAHQNEGVVGIGWGLQKGKGVESVANAVSVL